jgi:hypothetical protein
VKVLVACEFSGIMREAFRKQGHDAWSCDFLPTEIPGQHLQCDVKKVLYEPWDLIIAHPPCTKLSNASNVWIHKPGRLQDRERAMKFFMLFIQSRANRIAVENPKGYPERVYRKPDQIIHPYQFGHPYRKPTCLWLKNLPLLVPTNVVSVEPPQWDGKRNRSYLDQIGGGSRSGERNRSRTFLGIAEAMACQWGSGT